MASEAHTNETRSGHSIYLRKLVSMPFLVATAVYCVFIFYLSSISSFPVEPPFPFFDELVHACLFGVLAAIVGIGLWRAERGYSVGMRMIVPVAFCFLYGLTDEIHQVFVPYRTFDVIDLAADVAGAAFAAVILVFVQQRTVSRGR